MGSQRTDVVTVGSVTGRLYKPNGVRSWRTQSGVYDPETKRPFYIYVPFGHQGMGMSIEHNRGRGQHHYSLDIDVDTWNRTNDRLQLGLVQSTIDLSGITGIQSITKISEVARDTSGNMYVYLVNPSAFLPKIRLDTMALIGSTKEFTQGGTEVLTDLLVVKDGSDVLTTGSPRTLTQVGNGILLAAFGNSTTMMQADAIAVNATDTWGGTSGTAYGGVLWKTQGTTPGETWIWKSSGQSGSGYVNGAFSRLMYLAVSTSGSIDYSNTATWNPATPYQVGDYGTPITGMAEYNRGLIVAKPEGIYAFDSNFNSSPIATMRGYMHDSNGRSIVAWLNTLVWQTRRDLATPQGLIGLTRLVSNTSPVQGYPTAVATWGDRLFTAFYDGTDTYIVMLKPREGESVENPYVVWPITKLASKACYAMRVITRANGDTILLYGKGADLGYCIIDPIASRLYASSGEWYSARIGEPGRPMVLEQYSFRVKTAGANVNITPSYEWDESGSFTAGSAQTSSGRKDITLTAGTSDTGDTLRFKMALATNSNASTPVLIGGGVYVRGHYTGDTFDRITFVIHAGTHSASGIGSDAATIYSTLKGYEGTNQNVVYSDFFGDSSNHVLHIETVQYAEGLGDAEQASERYIEVTARKLQGTS